ncbi:hypothetical protein AGR13a_Cc240035 [Agrobacterium genomosp. 13 str. CFBP 6927]|uniref:Uncharacterized protein n=1 Tax=Agrobacterium genomosp. 13 str. CFBP 6927 TaxID=1183428 RepID=A0ABP2BGE6_9HYPH|nr:hypothetical protein AGR13a_Cc240035 [Agrobacterium genomosp. 13 str. CFBP 6927]
MWLSSEWLPLRFRSDCTIATTLIETKNFREGI